MDQVRHIARAVLYEGYLLWPYRKSALKNRHRFTIGGLYPDAYAAHSADRSWARFDCLVEGADPALEIEIRFLRLDDSEIAREESIVTESFPASRGRAATFRAGNLSGTFDVAAIELRDGLRRVSLKVTNDSTWEGDVRDEALRHTLIACHLVARARDGAFISTIDPPAELAADALACRSDGLWPVLVGEPGARDTLLASAIILEEYPQIAPESSGDFFDGCEIDELLVHSIRALTDAEKEEIRSGDPRGREILERVESLTADDIRRLHGGRVVLHPRGGGDALTAALEGRRAVIESVERDYEGKTSLAVVLENDPAHEIGKAQHLAHRFFFAPDEVEPLAEGAAPERRVLIAGIGNVFLGDDGFGVAVVQRLARMQLAAGVKAVEFGIRGMDLAYALGEGYDLALLIDAAPRGGIPGTIEVIEPAEDDRDDTIEGHGMSPRRVLALAERLGNIPPRTLLVGCEPAVIPDPESDEILDTLSPQVDAAVDRAVEIVLSLVKTFLDETAAKVGSA